MNFQTVIGLEVHVQLTTNSKAFCSCPVLPEAEPNTTICPVCTGHPGTLPVLNRRMVDDAILLGLATSCTIRRESTFSRKNYFYPDLPKGYQITQYEDPICHDGCIDVTVDGEARNIGIARIHMEEDAGKLLHTDGGETLVDFNRCGTPLLEIVTAPDIRSPREAAACLREIHRLVTWLGICTGSMEQGAMRCDANISLRPDGGTDGTRTEIKNLNSFRFVERALAAEARRQEALLAAGQGVRQCTLLYDERSGGVRVMRSKEAAEDYRYFPEPDLPPVVVTDERIDTIGSSLPELPHTLELRLQQQYALDQVDARVLSAQRDRAQYYLDVVDAAGPALATEAAHWVQGEVQRALSERGCAPADLPVTPRRLADVLLLVADGTVSRTAARQVFTAMLRDEGSAADIVNALGLRQITDTAELRELARRAVEAHPAQADAYRNGKHGLLGFFVGELLRLSSGRVDPARGSLALRQVLEEK